MKLDQLAQIYGSDKSSKAHGYTRMYASLFDRAETVAKVAEIGVQRGGKWRNNHEVPSLKMWQQYFYNSSVYGFDIKRIKTREPNITLYNGDQSNADDLKAFAQLIGTECDLIIDDGSHRPDDQILSFQILSPLVRVGGYFVIEDCNAVIQAEYEPNERIHARVERLDYTGFELSWHASNKAGEKSIALFRRVS